MEPRKTTKLCPSCQNVLPITAFDHYIYNGRPQGRRRWCHECQSAREQELRNRIPVNPSGLCMCGCGNPAPIATNTRRARGDIQGLPCRFIPGHNRRKSPVDYIIDQETQCWIWQLAVSDTGYGATTVNGVNMSAHKAQYERKYGPVPSDHELHHRCRRRICCNPDHLEPLTYAEHAAHSVKIKLTPSEVSEIRSAPQSISTKALAGQYGVSTSHMSRVRRSIKS